MGESHRQPDDLHDLAGVDRVIHEPARLMILLYLYTVEKADFLFLLNATELTWGNLSSHVSKLESAGYVVVEKTFVAKKPRTILELTAAGRRAVESYRTTMAAALRTVKK